MPGLSNSQPEWTVTVDEATQRQDNAPQDRHYFIWKCSESTATGTGHSLSAAASFKVLAWVSLLERRAPGREINPTSGSLALAVTW